MEYDKDKVDEMVLALLSLTMFEDRPGVTRLERARLGSAGPAAQEGVYLGPEKQSEVGLDDRRRR